MNAARARIEGAARALDDRFEIPGVRIRFGWDAILGLIPGVGDVIALFLSLYILSEGIALKVPPSVLLRMLANVGIDAMVGAIPIVGDLFDVVWKANRRNRELLFRYMDQPQKTARGSKVWVAGAFGLVMLVVGLLIVGVVMILGVTINWVSQYL